nr:glycosyltransferase [Roseimicrobium sp. ORNL1]
MLLPETEKQVPFLSVCIVTRGRPALLRECLEIVINGQSLSREHYDVIVSDDDPEHSAKKVVEEFAGVTWVSGPARGVAANRNKVVGQSRGEWIVFVDDDELPEPNWLAEVHKAALSGQWDVIEGVVQPTDYPDSIFWYAPTVESPGLFCTANLAIRRDTFVALGGFDEQFAISHEDMDLGRRIRNAGVPTTFLPKAVVKHPARRQKLKTIFTRTVQQQYQTYRLLHPTSRGAMSGIGAAVRLSQWTMVYLFRCTRINAAVAGWQKWRSFCLESGIRVLCAPIAAMRIWHGERDVPGNETENRGS